MPEDLEQKKEAHLLYEIGEEAFDSDPPNLQEAEEYFRKALELLPDSGHIVVTLANCMYFQKKYQDVLSLTSKAISLLPDDPRPIITRAATMMELKEYQEAVCLYEEALSLKPEYTEEDVLLSLAGAHEKLGQIDKAIELWKKIEKMEPAYPSYEQPMEAAREKLKEYKVII